MIQLEKAQKALAEAQEAEESEEVLETARTRAMLAEVQLVEAQEMMNEIEAVLAEQQTHALEAEAALAEARALETESELAELETAEVEAMLAEAKALDEALKATIAESETVDLGNDNIFLVIQASTKSTFLKEVQQDIRKYGIFFRFTELEYNDNGEITKIALAVKTNSGFSGHAFSYNDGGPIKEPLVFYRVPDEDPPHGIFIGSDKKIPESVKKVMKKMTGYFTGNWE